MNLDLDADGEVVGVEAAVTKPKQIEILARVAQERALSLDGVFAAPATPRKLAPHDGHRNEPSAGTLAARFVMAPAFTRDRTSLPPSREESGR